MPAPGPTAASCAPALPSTADGPGRDDARRAPSRLMNAGVVTLAVPCRTDEPALDRTLAAALASWWQAPQAARSRLEILVCLNGPASSAPEIALEECARGAGAATTWVDADQAVAARPAPAEPL